ncbi:MAG: Do family serine endopeptidase [Thermoguttaceae bacterium]
MSQSQSHDHCQCHRQKHRHRRWLVVGSLIVVVGLGSTLWRGAIGQDRPGTDRTASQAAETAIPPVVDPEAVSHAKSLSRAFRAVAKAVQPTVVKITTSTKPQRMGSSRGMPQGNPFKGTPFEDFFGEGDMPGFQFRHPPIPRRQGVGSGVIIDPKGIILTNNHVVDGADEVTIELPNGEVYKAVEIKTDEQTDLAVVMIEPDEPLPAATMGDSDQMEIGDWVLAIGNQFGLEGTVTAGIISGKERSLAPNRRAELLQTDAAINPGNSGGPLVNLDGHVIGISTAIASTNGGYQGVGFAIPINLAKWVTAQLIESGQVRRAYLGVEIREVDAQLATELGVRPGEGVAVERIFPDTPAAAAGFQADDIIRTFAGHSVTNPRELQEAVERSQPGTKQRVDIVRNGKPETLSVVVKPLPKDFGTARGPSLRHGRGEDTPGYTSDDLGLDVDDLTEELAEKLGYEGFAGVVITGVDVDGIAATAGISEGMLILKVGSKVVKSVADFEAAMKGESLEEGILLLIRAKDSNRFIVLQAS